MYQKLLHCVFLDNLYFRLTRLTNESYKVTYVSEFYQEMVTDRNINATNPFSEDVVGKV